MTLRKTKFTPHLNTDGQPGNSLWHERQGVWSGQDELLGSRLQDGRWRCRTRRFIERGCVERGKLPAALRSVRSLPFSGTCVNDECKVHKEELGRLGVTQPASNGVQALWGHSTTGLRELTLGAYCYVRSLGLPPEVVATALQEGTRHLPPDCPHCLSTLSKGRCKNHDCSYGQMDAQVAQVGAEN